MKLAPPENTYLTFLLLVFLGIGFFGANYYMEHASRFVKSTKPLYSTNEILRTRTLSHRLHGVEYQNAHLESEIAELNLKTTQQFEDTSPNGTFSRYTGLLPQEGPGVEVTLKDSVKPLLLGDNANTGIIHNTDILQVVNELRGAGAKAISVNNQPIMTLTSISCSGPIIMVNGTRITSPFTVLALGDPQKIQQAEDKPTSYLKELKTYGIETTLTPRNLVSIPAYTQETTDL